VNRPDSLAALHLDDFLDLTTDAIILINREQQILLFNRAAEQIFGYTEDEIVGQALDWLIPPRDLHQHGNYIRSFVSAPEPVRRMAERMEIAGIRKDGSEFPVEASIAKLVRGEETFLAVFLRDISGRKKNEQDLLKWAHAFEHAEWGVVVGRADATTLETMNPAFARLYGYSREDLTGMPIKNLYVPEDRPKVGHWIRQAHRKGHITYEARHLRKDGTIFPALVDITAVKDEANNVLYRVVNVLDITERKQVEEALRESEERYSSIVKAMEEGIVLQDDQGVIRTCNASAERILGLTADQMIGRSSLDPRWNAIHADGSPFPGPAHPSMQTLQTGRPNSNVVMGIHRPDGSLTWISVNTQPLCRLGNDMPYAVVASFSEINERLQLYQMLEQRVEERTQELTALLEVSRNVASTMDLQPLLFLILSQLKKVVDYTGGGVIVQGADGFTMLEYIGPTPRGQMVNQFIPANRAAGYLEVLRRKEPVIIDDIWGNDQWVRQIQEQSRDLMDANLRYAHSWLGIPMITKDRIIGLLRIDHVDPGYFNSEHARLASAFAEQAALAIEKARLYEQAQALAAMQERQKLARELHDSVSQALYGIALGVRTARTLLDRDPAKVVEPLEYCLSLAEAGLAEMRSLIFELRPESLQLEGLVAALAKQAAAMQARHSVQVITQFCDEPAVSLAVKEAFYRITQESLQNVARHAHASRIELTLRRSNEMLILDVKDNGQGFDVGAEHPGHLGLRSMRERIEHVGGEFHIESARGQGTQLRVQVRVS
jgi:PAS domain S-box-containing protein